MKSGRRTTVQVPYPTGLAQKSPKPPATTSNLEEMSSASQMRIWISEETLRLLDVDDRLFADDIVVRRVEDAPRRDEQAGDDRSDDEADRPEGDDAAENRDEKPRCLIHRPGFKEWRARLHSVDNRIAGVIQLVECQLPKLDVAGSSPVARSGKSL